MGSIKRSAEWVPKAIVEEILNSIDKKNEKENNEIPKKKCRRNFRNHEEIFEI